MAVPGPDDPRFWPEAEAAGAHWFDPPTDVFDGWVVLGELPPEPFLSTDFFLPRDWPRAVYGPPGTVWAFDSTDVVERLTGLDLDHGALVVGRLLKKFGKLPLASVPLFFTIPNSYPPTGEPPMPMNWIRTVIVGEVGAEEQVAHGINWRHESIENAVPTPEVVKLVGDAVRDAWFLYFDGQKGNFSPELRYSEVRSSFITLSGPGSWVEYGAGANQTEHAGAKPEWPLPTQVSPFGPSVRGTGTTSLPYEVACCLSLNTNTRGTSRFKGRLYLGPLAVSVMGGLGQFDRDVANILAGNFGSGVFGGVIGATDYKPHVISEKYCTSAEITGVRVGVTPDSQRRRRRNIAENYVQRWGTPVGGA